MRHEEEKAGVWLKDLWYVVESVKANFGIDSTSFDIKFFKWAMDVYRDMSLANVMKSASRTIHIPIPKYYFEDENQQEPAVWPPVGPPQGYHVKRQHKKIRIQLPVDFIDYQQVGIDCHGYIQPLDYNERIITTEMPVSNCCGDELEQQLERDRLCNCGGESPHGGFIGDGYYDWGFSPFWKNGQFVGGAYGRSAYRYKGAFTIDWDTREIVLDRCTHPRHGIVLTYLSNGIGEGNVNIQNGTEDALIAGVEAKKAYYEFQAKPAREQGKVGMAFVSLADKKYHKHVKRVNARKMAMTTDEIRNAWNRSIKQSPKR